MASHNSATLVGRLGGDPQMRYTPQGTAVTSFNIAVDDPFAKRENDSEKTDWFKVTAWGKLAETCSQYLVKGQLVMIVGRVGLDEWDGNDGQHHARLALNARELVMLGKGADQGARQEESAGGDIEPDDIPF